MLYTVTFYIDLLRQYVHILLFAPEMKVSVRYIDLYEIPRY